ncbi:MAG: hypothetical protein K0S26_1172 [Bacteroidota bacterium]|nr:hypothetical protein [Bacteroidota bacterium]
MRIILFAFLIISTRFLGQVCFDSITSRISYIPGGCQKFVTGDFNEDGKLDVVVPNSSTYYFAVLLGNAQGGFTSQTTYTTSYAAKNVVSADVNNDNHKDLVFLSYYGTPSMLTVALGNGNGTFTEVTTFSVTTTNGSYLDVRDINNDTHLDIVTLISGPSFTSAFQYNYGNGTGQFLTSSTFNTGIAFSYTYLKNDFNADGKVDYASVTQSNNISFIYGTTNGSFSSPSNIIPINHPVALEIFDYNNDSKQDLAIAYGSNNDSLGIYTGDGTGQFTLLNAIKIPDVTNEYPYTTGVSVLLSSDINGDSYQDILVHTQGSFFLVLLNDGAGNFTPGAKFSIGIALYDVLLKDINNDGNKDLLQLYSNTSGKFVVNLNTPSSARFEKSRHILVSGSPFEISTADFDHDGHNDIATAADGQITVLYGAGNGETDQIKGHGTASTNWAMDVADFNNDGWMDMFSASKVYINTGSRTFSLALNGLNASAYEVDKGDFNNDGNVDILIPNDMFNNIIVKFGNGAGAFPTSTSAVVGSAPLSTTVADFNNDNFDDVATIINTAQQLSISMNNGAGQFLTAVTYTANARPFIVRSGDLNKDGNIDLVIANFTSGGTQGTVRLLYGNGTGTFPTQTSVIFNGTVAPQGMVLEDINNDSYLDVAVSHETTAPLSFITLYYSDGAGGLKPPVYYYNTNKSYDVAFVDYNGDGVKDMISADKKIQGLSILFGRTPVINFGISDTTICAGMPVTLTPGGAVTYTWSGVTPPTGAFTPTTTTTYTLVGENACGFGTNQLTINVIQSTPTLSVTQISTTVCEGSSVQVQASVSDNYTWFNGATTQSISIVGYNDSLVTVSSVNICGVATSSLAIITNTLCQDVWPGDANSDGVADNLDVLELGLHFTQTGSARSTTSNTWQSYFANNWTGTITTGKNLNHSDCNGDGIINADDTLAIYNNYGLNHAFKPVQTATVNPQLTVIPDQSSVVKGSWGTASIYLGDATNNINNINGVAFSINFDNSLIETNSVWLEYPSSFINASNQNLHFRKLCFGTNTLYTATTHTVSNNVTGNGLIAILHYKIKSSLVTDEILNIGISQANQSNASGVISPLTSGTGTLMTIGSSVGFHELNGSIVSISPNPTNGFLTVKSKTDLQKIEVLSITGQAMLTEIPASTSHMLNLESFANGIYFVNVYQNDRIVKREKVVLNK